MRPIDADLLEKQLLELAGDNPQMFHYFSEAIGIIWKQPTISALEKQIKLNEIGFTEEVIENYKIFEDECITKGFTFKSLLDAIDKPINGGWVKCSERLPDIELNQAKEERGILRINGNVLI